MIYKRGRYYWYKFVFNGELIRESTKQGNDKIARNMESDHRARLAREQHERIAARERLQCSDVTRCDECEKLFNAEKALKLGTNTFCSDVCRAGWQKKHTDIPTLKTFCTERIESYAKARNKWIWYRAGIRALLKYEALASARLNEIGSEKAAGFAAWRLDHDEVQPCSINSTLRVLRAILRHAHDWGVIEAAPKIKLLDGESRRERVVTPEEERAYLAAAPLFLQQVATILFDTGMRPDEMHRMMWEHVQWEHGRHGAVLVTKGKTGAARRLIPMTPRVRAVLEARWAAQKKPQAGWVWPNSESKSGHISHSSYRKLHRDALKKSKVIPFVLYSARHTFLTRLGASGCDVWTLMRVAGHSSITISSRYVHPQEDAIQRAFANLGSQAQQVTNGGRHKSRHNLKRRFLREKERNSGNPREYRREMVSAAGFEPATHALKGHCSTS